MATGAHTPPTVSDSTTNCGDPSCTVFQLTTFTPTPNVQVHSTTPDRASVKEQYYKTYDPMTGVRIAGTLGGFIVFFCLFLLYKTKCKAHRDYSKAPVADPCGPPLFQVSVLAEGNKDYEDFPPLRGSFSHSQQDPCAQGFHSSYARFHAYLAEGVLCASTGIDSGRQLDGDRELTDRNSSGADSPLIGAVGISHNFNSPPTRETALSPENSPSRGGLRSSYDRRNHIRSYSPEMEVGEPSGISGTLLAIDADDESSEWEPRSSAVRTLLDQPTCSWHLKHLTDDSSSEHIHDSDSSGGETLLFMRPHVERSSDITPEVSETKC